MMFRFKLLLFILLLLCPCFVFGFDVVSRSGLNESTFFNIPNTVVVQVEYVPIGVFTRAEKILDMSVITELPSGYVLSYGIYRNNAFSSSSSAFLLVYNYVDNVFYGGSSVTQSVPILELFSSSQNISLVNSFVSRYVRSVQLVNLSSLSSQIFAGLKPFWVIFLSIGLSLLVLNIVGLYYPPLRKFIGPLYAPRYIMGEDNGKRYFQDTKTGRVSYQRKGESDGLFESRFGYKTVSDYSKQKRDFERSERKRRDDFWGGGSSRRRSRGLF